MGQGNADDIRLFLTDEAAARAQADQDREELLATSRDDFARVIESLLMAADAAVLRGELAEYQVSSPQDGLAPGSEGWWEDNCMVRPWGFDLAGIAVPVLLLHGRQDMFVPFGHTGYGSPDGIGPRPLCKMILWKRTRRARLHSMGRMRAPRKIICAPATWGVTACKKHSFRYSLRAGHERHLAQNGRAC